jgi:hypothetical protein
MARNALTFIKPVDEAFYTLTKSNPIGVMLFGHSFPYKLENVGVLEDELVLAPECMVEWND